jgi:hypothetical protein
MTKIDSINEPNKPKDRYKVTNWKEYNSGLKRRGSLTLWVDDSLGTKWYHVGPARIEVGKIPTRPESMQKKAIEKQDLKFNLVIMKFEKISDDKFKMFAPTSLKNLNAIVGGGIDTDRPGTGTHDTAYTYSSSGQDLDTIRKTDDGKSDDSAGDLV